MSTRDFPDTALAARSSPRRDGGGREAAEGEQLLGDAHDDSAAGKPEAAALHVLPPQRGGGVPCRGSCNCGAWRGPPRRCPIALTVVDILRPALVCLLGPRRLFPRTWTGWSTRALRGWRAVLRISPGELISLWSQWRASEIMVVLAGMLCVAETECVEATVQPTLWNIAA